MQENISGIKRPAIRWSFIGILAASMIGFFLVLAEVGFDTDFVLREWYNEKIEWIINFLMVMYSIQVLMIFLPGPPGITNINLIVKVLILALLSLHFFDFIPFDIAIESTSGYKLEWLTPSGKILSMVYTGDTKPEYHSVQQAAGVNVFIHEINPPAEEWAFKNMGLYEPPKPGWDGYGPKPPQALPG